MRTDNRMLALDRLAALKGKLGAEADQGRVRLSVFCDKYLEWAWAEKPASAKREEQRLSRSAQEWWEEDFQN